MSSDCGRAKVGRKTLFEKNSKPESLIRLLLVVVGIPALVVGEFGLRYYALSDRDGKYYVWPPNMQKVFRPTPGTMPGWAALPCSGLIPTE